MASEDLQTPVLVGIGVAQRKEQDWRNALEPVDLMCEAAREFKG